MYCGKCGTYNPDDSKFCCSCGENLSPENSAPEGQADVLTSQAQSQKHKLVGIAAVAVAAVVVISIIISLFAGSGFKSVAKKFGKAQQDLDFQTAVFLAHKKAIEEESGLTVKEVKKSIKEEMKDEYSKDIIKEIKKTHYKVKYTDAVDADTDDLKYIRRRYKENYGLNVSAAKYANYSITARYDGESVEDENSALFVKINGKWYVDVDEIDNYL